MVLREESEGCWDDLATQYQHIIEVLRWSVEVKPVDLIAEVSILLSFRLPFCEKYVETAHWIYIYGRKSV